MGGGKEHREVEYQGSPMQGKSETESYRLKLHGPGRGEGIYSHAEFERPLY